jgi:hypothetical protein
MRTNLDVSPETRDVALNAFKTQAENAGRGQMT